MRRRKSAKSRSFVHESSYVDSNVEIGDRTRIWHFCHILRNSKIGSNCTLGQNVMVGPDVSIGDNCRIQNNVSIFQGVTLEDEVFCGPSVVFTNVLNPRAAVSRRDEFAPTHVMRGASIGANATIVCGTVLGEFCLVGAGSVVTRDVPAFALVVGVPARRVGWVSHAGEILNEELICPREGTRYKLADEDRLEVVSCLK
jgi:UDP-2-acetamido-3-amino-2,3-dideoxy-glucuronate N-acetyltransferase